MNICLSDYLKPRYLYGLFSGLIFIYFIYHTYHGERGLIARDTLTKEFHILTKKHEKLHQKRVDLENKINSLGAGDGQIDPDLLGEYARKMGYIMPNEIMITE